MQKPNSSALIIGAGGHAVAIDPMSGAEIWRTKLKSSSFVTIHQSTNRVYAGANGVLFCLDVSTGQVLWQNKLTGLGMGLVAFPSTNEATSLAAIEARNSSSV